MTCCVVLHSTIVSRQYICNYTGMLHTVSVVYHHDAGCMPCSFALAAAVTDLRAREHAVGISWQLSAAAAPTNSVCQNDILLRLHMQSSPYTCCLCQMRHCSVFWHPQVIPNIFTQCAVQWDASTRQGCLSVNKLEPIAPQNISM